MNKNEVKIFVQRFGKYGIKLIIGTNNFVITGDVVELLEESLVFTAKGETSFIPYDTINLISKRGGQ